MDGLQVAGDGVGRVLLRLRQGELDSQLHRLFCSPRVSVSWSGK